MTPKRAVLAAVDLAALILALLVVLAVLAWLPVEDAIWRAVHGEV